MSVSVQAVSLLSMVDCLIASEAYLFARLWRRGTLSSTTGAAIGWQGTRTEQLSSMIFLFLLCSMSAFLRGKPVGRRQLSETWTPQHTYPLCMDLGILALIRAYPHSRWSDSELYPCLLMCHKSSQHWKDILSFRHFHLGSCVCERKAKGSTHNCGREQPSWKSSGWFPVFWIPCAAWAWACASSRCGLLVRDPSTSTKSCMTHHHAPCTPGWSADECTRQAREAAETLSLVPPGRAPALGSCQDQQRQQPARTLDPACKQPLTV